MANVQNKKFIYGPLPHECVTRTELLARIEQAADNKIIVISALAGSGKTVSVLQWVYASNRIPVWIALDSYDNPTAIFYRMFCAGLLSVLPDIGNMAAILRDPAFDRSPVEYTIRLLTELSPDDKKYALVLDDYHTIINQEIQESLPFILRRLPITFVTLILSRTEPDDSIVRAIEAGQAVFFGQEDLAFSTDEVKKHFAALGRGDKEAEAASVFTGGWAIGVNALAQSDAPVLDGQGGHLLDHYIEKNIWIAWDEDMRRHMIVLAALDEMPVSLCEKIIARNDSGKLLESFRANNVFVSRIEDGVYHYHHLFLNFLRAQPEYCEVDHSSHWYAASKYYFEKGEYLTAQRYAYKSGNVELLLHIWDELLNSTDHDFDEYLTFSKELIQLDTIGALCEKCPVFYIACACTAFISGDAHLYKKNMDKLWYALPTILQKYQNFGELAFALFLLDFRTPFSKHIKQLAKLPSIGFIKFIGEEMRVATISLQMPFVHRSSRDYYELTDLSLYGKLDKALKKFLRKHYSPAICCVKSGILLEQNRLDDALSEAQVNMANMAPWIIKEMRFAMYMHLAAVYFALGRDEELGALLEKAELFINTEALFLLPNFLAFTARIKLWDGNESAARKWLDNYSVAEVQTLETYRLYQYFTTVRAYAVLGEYSKAKELAMRLRQFGKEYLRPQDAAEAGVLLAVFLWVEHRKEEAQEMMETVLLEMQPYAFIRLIADEGSAVLPLLRKIERKVGHADYQGELNSVYINNIYLSAYAVSKRRTGILAKRESLSANLSKQQKNILQLLSQGYKRKDIIKMTGLSLSTIKTHINLLYKKLDVNNVADAVLRAAELQILG